MDKKAHSKATEPNVIFHDGKIDTVANVLTTKKTCNNFSNSYQ